MHTCFIYLSSPIVVFPVAQEESISSSQLSDRRKAGGFLVWSAVAAASLKLPVFLYQVDLSARFTAITAATPVAMVVPAKTL